MMMMTRRISQVRWFPCHQKRITLPDDSDAFFGTDRIVFVRSGVRQGAPVRPRDTLPSFALFLFGSWSCRKLIKGVA
jgi:hypothetical protein